MRTAAILVLLLLTLAPTLAAAGLAFGPAVPLRVDTGVTIPLLLAEPSLVVAPDGTITVAGNGYLTSDQPSFLFQSTNGGASYHSVPVPMSNSGGPGDADLAIDGAGRLYASALLDGVPISVYTNPAAGYDYATLSSPLTSNDRQWVGATGDGIVYSTWYDLDAQALAFAKSTDAARTWQRGVAVQFPYFGVHGVVDASASLTSGKILVASPDDVYVPYLLNVGNVAQTERAALVAITHDGGATWEQHEIAPVTGANSAIFPTLARDAAGTLYEAWADAGPTGANEGRILLSTSDDDGVTWSAPQTLSSDANYNVFPTLVADAPGRVAVAWYEGAPPGGIREPMTEAALATPWRVKVLLSTDGAQSWTAGMATGIIHTGAICTMGVSCVGGFLGVGGAAMPGNRDMLDFFTLAEKPDGSMIIAFSKDSTITIGGAIIQVVQQTGGPTLK